LSPIFDQNFRVVGYLSIFIAPDRSVFGIPDHDASAGFYEGIFTTAEKGQFRRIFGISLSGGSLPFLECF